MKTLAPIVLFVYNRPQHTLKTLEALAQNKQSKKSVLYIYADGAKDGANRQTLEQIDETRKVIRLKQWCKEVHIIESSQNKGLAQSIIDGVTKIVNEYGKIIVLEDDIVASPYFLQYMNTALDMYEHEDKVMHISSFVPDADSKIKLPNTYFLRFMSCWGWATWEDSWSNFVDDFEYLHETLPERKDYSAFNLEDSINMFEQVEANLDGRINTWAIKWYSTIFLQNGLCLYPKESLVKNIGFDGSGHNCGSHDKHNVELSKKRIQVRKIQNIEEHKSAKEFLRTFYLYGKKPYAPPFSIKVKNKLSRIARNILTLLKNKDA